MIKLTYRDAMNIQHAQMMYYRQRIGRQGIKAIRSATKPCPGDPDALQPVIEINRLVPRGGDFEALPRTKTAVSYNDLAVHDAIRRGLPY